MDPEDLCRGCPKTHIPRSSILIQAFNANGIVYDNTPWRPGREMELVDQPISDEDERKLKNVATRITSNGVELLVKDKNVENKQEQRKVKYMHMPPALPYMKLSPSNSLLSSAVATYVNHQHLNALYPLHPFMRHNYIIKTCMTTYTYLTTVVQNKRSAISTFETIVSVVTTESLTNLFATELLPVIKATKTKYMELKTIQPSAPSNMFLSNYPKIDKRIDNEEDDSFDVLQPSEPSHIPCTTSCSCSHTKTEGLKTKHTNPHQTMTAQSQYGVKNSKYGSIKMNMRPTKVQSFDKNTQYGPYEYENSQITPTDRIVEKYTEVISDYSDEKDSNSVEETELLTNEQAPKPPETNKDKNNKTDKNKPDKPQKPNKNKVLVADLLKLGSLGIKGLSQLAPVFEKMTGSFMKRQDPNKTTTTTTTTMKPEKLTAYHANQRIDSDIESRQNFPIYIPVDELETSESQLVFTNATLHQNLAWATEHKQPKAHFVPPKIIHESPLVNGGIPISPGEIITANSDVIVGKPAVGGPLTLAASGIKLHNPVNPPTVDSFVAGNEQYVANEKPSMNEHILLSTKVDDSFDLRPPEMPKSPKLNRIPRPAPAVFSHQISHHLNKAHSHLPSQSYPHPVHSSEHMMKTEHIQTTSKILGNHGRPALLDYIPSLGKPSNRSPPLKQQIDFSREESSEEMSDNSPSSSEVINTRLTLNGDYAPVNSDSLNKPLLVDIQPSRVANVIIPHGSATALVIAGSSEPHKTGEYIDDPLPYPEPGYFGSFSIDAPKMTNVHNVAPSNKKQHVPKSSYPHLDSYKPINPPIKETPYRNDLKFKWRENKRPTDFHKIPPPTSNQESHVQIGPQITVYNPDIYKPNNGDFEKYNHIRDHHKIKDGKEVIDKEYEKYLAVPPPPPPKMHYNQENHNYEKNKPYNQRPVVHIKPVQDMKVFLNIQHPVPTTQKPEPLPPKVTSEIYFASQAPNSQPSPTYTIQITPAAPTYGNNFNSMINNVNTANKYQHANQHQNAHGGIMSNSFSVVSSPNFTNKSIFTNDLKVSDKDNTYTVTLNTATNVANHVGETSQVIGSSVPVAISSNDEHTNIPIGTNFAIRVEDERTPSENFNLNKNVNSPIVYDEHGRVPPIGDNRWNKSTEYYRPQSETTVIGNHYYNHGVYTNNFSNNYDNKNQNQAEHANNTVGSHLFNQNQAENVYENIRYKPSTQKPNFDVTTYRNTYYTHKTINEPQEKLTPTISQPINSHANFPMTNEVTTPSPAREEVKPVTEEVDEKISEQKRPGKLIPNIPTNSHGWYSSILANENSINNLKVEGTTRKSIPLTYDYKKENVPDFGQKITTVGKPPSDFWPDNTPPVINNFNVGQPFSKISTERPASIITQSVNKPYFGKYIPTFGSKQPVYDIPIRDNSDETTTAKSVKHTQKPVKPVFEDSEEVYDGEEEFDNVDGDVAISQESMKVPIVTSSNEEQIISEDSKTSTEKYKVSNEINQPSIDQSHKDSTNFVDFNPGTQTEKPFGSNNNTFTFQSNAMKPIYNTVKPRPFTMNTDVLDHQLQQPHWQINQLMVNSSNASYEESLDLNIGEEITSGTRKSTPKPLTSQNQKEYNNSKFRRPQRPVISYNNTRVVNDSSIITSTVHINDKKPLIVEDIPVKSTSPPVSLGAFDFNEKSSSEIIDLSPPPPTVDYSFKPSTNDEMIMGMSPPPPLPSIKPPIRTQPTPRPIPVRTPPPYRSKPPRTLPPKVSSTPRPLRRPIIHRDEVSTYRPAYDILNNVKRPVFNRDQPSSQLLPPPREIPTKVVSPINDLPSPTLVRPSVPTVIFPTPTSSGWLTSSGVGFSTNFNFAPTSVYFPEVTESSKVQESTTVTSSEKPSSYEVPSSSEYEDLISQKPTTENKITTSSEISTEPVTKYSTSSSKEEEDNVSFEVSSETSKEEVSTEQSHIASIPSRNRTRKPYPNRHDDKKQTSYKYRPPVWPSSTVIRPSKTLTRPDILYPTRHSTTRKILRPIPTRSPTVSSASIIESSESSIDDYFVKPTETIKEVIASTIPAKSGIIPGNNILSESSIPSLIKSSLEEPKLTVLPTHHAGNEVKISDEIVPTKTEFRTTVVTLTKTLSEPPSTVSSIGYVNLTHTLTVTHTKTSLVSKSEGAVTQTLVLTNTQTSTVVDVVTKIHTQVQPTTIVETVTKHIPIVQVAPTPVHEIPARTKVPLDDLTMSSEEENFIIKDNDTTENIQKIETESEGDNDTFFVVMNKSQNGGKAPPIRTDIETGEYDITRNEQVNNNGVSQVLFGEILLAGTPYLETNNVGNPTGIGFGKECQPDCKASRNERCQRIDGIMKCVCRPGFARMFPDRPCKPTYTYSVKLALGSQGNKRLKFHENLADNSTKEYHALALATHEGINRMVMQSDLRDVYHGVHITGFHPVEMRVNGEAYQGVMNDFYVQLSDNAHENRLKEVIEKYLRNNNYSLGGTEVHAAGELVERLEVSDFDECTSGQFHDCSEHAQCFNLRGTYTCSCLEGFADLSVNTLYPGRICSAEPVGCERCNYHGACYSRDDRRVLCECFQWYAGSTCHINLKVVLISLVVAGALLTTVLAACAVVACRRPRTPRPPRSIVTCIQSMPALHQGGMPSKQRADRRALITDRGDGGDTSSLQNASLPYMPAKNQRQSTNGGKKCVISDPPSHDPPPPPAPAVMIPRARLHPHHSESRENIARKKSMELTSVSEAKLISYLESGAVSNNEEMRRKHSMESSYSANKERQHTKQGALISAGFKVSTTVRPEENMQDDRDDMSSVNKADLEAELAHLDALRKSYSHEDLSEWTDAERRIGELTLSEARSVGGTLPASTGRAASSTRMTHQEANTMAERDLGSTFLLPHVHLYKPDLTSDVSEFDSL